ncbi:MAG TPA: hypothetical protein VG125_09755 [Pirellulales bacterium]|jgi:hypothetical protein|nr:hypothetical protein [Pirellulales bacterium]
MNDLASVSPPLQAAADADSIHEVFHPLHSVVRRTSPFLSARAATTIFAGGGAALAVVCLLLDLPIVLGLASYLFLGLPFLLACLLSRAAQKRQWQERTVSLAGGVVRFASGAEAEACLLERCCWFRGKATDDPVLSHQDIRQKAILLVFPSGRTVACGLTPPFDSQWLDAFRCHGCRQVLRQQGLIGWLVAALIIGGFIGGAWLGRDVGAALRDAFFPAPQNNPFGDFLPDALFILGAWAGAIVPMFIPGWLRHTKSERERLAFCAVRLPVKLAVFLGWFVGGNPVTGALLVLFFIALLLVLTRTSLWGERTDASREG